MRFPGMGSFLPSFPVAEEKARDAQGHARGRPRGAMPSGPGKTAQAVRQPNLSGRRRRFVSPSLRRPRGKSEDEQSVFIELDKIPEKHKSVDLVLRMVYKMHDGGFGTHGNPSAAFFQPARQYLYNQNHKESSK